MRALYYFLIAVYASVCVADDLLVEIDMDMPLAAAPLLPGLELPMLQIVNVSTHDNNAADAAQTLLLVEARVRVDYAAWAAPWETLDVQVLRAHVAIIARVLQVSVEYYEPFMDVWWPAETVWSIASARPWRFQASYGAGEYKNTNVTLDEDIELTAVLRPALDVGVCGLAGGGLDNASFCVFSDAAQAGGCECVPGYYYMPTQAEEVEERCQPCPAGTVKPDYGNASDLCGQCPSGHTSREGRTVCYPCLAGTYASPAQDLCLPCAAFSESAAEASACVCSAGATLDVSQQNCAPCPHGTFSDAANASACGVCDMRLATTASNGATACMWCLVGAFWLSEESACAACAAGTYSGAENASACDVCDAGTYAGDRGLSACVACAAGTFMDATNASVCENCGVGMYGGSPQATACQPCAAGFFNGQTNATACQACVDGYQPYQGASACVACPHPHMIASNGATACTCDRGAVFDVSKTRCGLCFAGFFKSNVGEGGCALCPPYSQSLLDGASVCASCVPGAVHVQGICRPCRPGYFFDASSLQTTTASDGGQCAQCAPGTYTASQGATVCLQCGAGSFANLGGAASCTPCPAFSVADPGSPRCACQSGWIMDAATQTCVPCPAGYVQLLTGGCVPCPLGTFAQGDGEGVFCTPCPLGTFAATIGALACTQCPPYMTTQEAGSMGCQCVYGAVLDWARGVCLPCPAGSYISADAGCSQCPPGAYSGSPMAEACADCPTNTIGPSSGMTACLRCDVWVTPDRTACHCAPGFFNATTASAATTTWQCQACVPLCRVGTYQTADCRFDADRQCTPCTQQCAAGSFSIAECSPVRDLVCWPCRARCGLGQFISRPCLPTSDILCQVCRAKCPRGTYLQAPCSLTSDRVCAPCPAGTYNAAEGDASACLDCAVNAVAKPGAAACLPCRAEEFRGPQRDVCYAGGCPAGSYPDSPQQTCAACPGGSYSPDGHLCVVCVGGCVSPAQDACVACAEPLCPSSSSSSS